MTDISAILVAIERGDAEAPARLWVLVYDELRLLAGAQMARELPGQTLDTTALVHEAYLRMAGDPTQAFANRRHFYAAAAGAMRRILIEAARSKARTKRGGGRRREPVDLDTLDPGADDEELLALHDALDAFAAKDLLKPCSSSPGSAADRRVRPSASTLPLDGRAGLAAPAWLHTAMSDKSGISNPASKSQESLTCPRRNVASAVSTAHRRSQSWTQHPLQPVPPARPLSTRAVRHVVVTTETSRVNDGSCPSVRRSPGPTPPGRTRSS